MVLEIMHGWIHMNSKNKFEIPKINIIYALHIQEESYEANIQIMIYYSYKHFPKYNAKKFQ